MPQFPVHFTFHAGVSRPVFQHVRLVGSWDGEGRHSEQWTTVEMLEFRDESGCPAFQAVVLLDAAQEGILFRWGVMADTPGTPNRWVIATELPDANSAARYRTFTLAAPDQQEHYWFATGRRFGAQKFYPENQAEPALRFSVWAPNARKVEVIFAV